MPWSRVESTSRPGRYYYFNSDTGESSWSRPAEWRLPDEGVHEKSLDSQKAPQGDVREGGADEAMECERWGEDEEVGMDIDLSAEEESHFLSEISQTRTTLTINSPAALQPQASTSPASYAGMLYLVLDTNVLLSHLNFLVELKDFAIKGVGRPQLIIPWAVMQELDALKTNSSKVGPKAKNAITFLHDCFSAGHPRIRGQTMEEVHTELDNIAIENNDDRILHCCLLYQAKVMGQGGVVVLFSNDVQLCSKAMVNNVRAFSRKTLLVELRVLCRDMQEATPTSYTHTAEFDSLVNNQLQKEASQELLDDLLCQAETILRDSLSVMVTGEMELAFDSLWSTVVAVKPPWTLKDLVHILEKHWIAVFGQVMHRCSYDDVLKKLIAHTKCRHKMVLDCKHVRSFISNSMLLLKAFPKRPSYKSVLAHSLASLDVLSRKLPPEPVVGLPKLTVQPPELTVRESELAMQLPELAVQSPVQVLTAHSKPQCPPDVSPPTPPVLPLTTPPSPHQSEGNVMDSLLPLVTLSVSEIAELTNNAPDLAEQQLPWLLNILLETTRHCLSRLAGCLASLRSPQQSSEGVVFITRLATLLETITTSMNHVLQNQMNVTALRDFRASLDAFLLTCLQLSCPLSLEAVCQLVPLQLDLLVQAVGEFSSALDTLRLLAQQYSLTLPPPIM